MKKLMPLSYSAILIAALLVSACGSSKKETPGDPAAGIEVVGITTCFNCHSDEQNPSGLPDPFGNTPEPNGDVEVLQVEEGAWLQSRHGNEDANPSFTQGIAEEITLPYDQNTCARCHDPLGDGQRLAELAPVGSPLGEPRPVVGCESCHGPGGNHFGIGPLGFDLDAPGVVHDVCSGCHELGTFHPDNSETISDLVIPDTHVDDPATDVIEGYVLNPDAAHSDEEGNTNNGTCTDCHRQHFFDLTINNQWVVSDHAGNLGDNPAGQSEDSPFLEDDFKSDAENRCQRCHTSTGFRNIANNQDTYDANNDTIPDTPNVFVATGEQRELIYCWACHFNNSGGIRNVTIGGQPGVKFPSGQVANLDDATGGSRLCMLCHQGRTDGIDVQTAIDTADTHARFINIHYFAAAATYFGSETNGGYQYPGKDYVGREEQFLIDTGLHVDVQKTTCIGCHLRLGEDTEGGLAEHNFVPQAPDSVNNPGNTDCTRCHDANATEFEDMRFDDDTDYDNDGDTSEGMSFEIDGLEEPLLAAIRAYAQNTIGTCIVYSDQYPYFFKDNGAGANACNGIKDADETTSYNVFDDTLLPAAYNYQVSQKEPCGYIHNRRYIIQLLIDSIEAVGGPNPGYIRPNGNDS